VNDPSDENLSAFKAAIAEQTPLRIVLFDTELRIVWVNATLAELCGIPGEQWVGRRLDRMLPGSGTGGVESMLRRVLETGERVTGAEYPGPVLFGSQSTQVWGCSAFRVRRADGTVVGVALIAGDATERSRDRERLALLNEASERIGSTLDLTRTAEETLDMLVPRIGDVAFISLLSYVLDGGPQSRFESDGANLHMKIVAVRWLPGRPVPELIRKGAVAHLAPSSLYYQWLAEGRTIFEPRLSDPSAALTEMLYSEFLQRRYRVVLRSGMVSGMTVPISARGVILGTVGIFRAREVTHWEAALAQDVVARSAVCLDNARVYSRERAIALELQRSMLPQSIAQVPGVELACHYEPANTAAEIGGDWFDVVQQPDGRVALIVGDVVGHDIHAASLMGQLRTVTRTLAALDLSPRQVLTRLDAVVADMGVEVGATCVYATLDPNSRHCVIARAGHPPPAVVRPAGTVEFLDLPAGLPLGVGGADFESVEFDLEPGSLLALYTDGLIESRHAAIDTGMGNLAQALLAGNAEPFGPRFASTLISRLVPDPADDIAVLIARTTEDAEDAVRSEPPPAKLRLGATDCAGSVPAEVAS
jgi:PAS domain S-box-containing protein